MWDRMQHTGSQVEGGDVHELDEYLTRNILNSLGTHELQLNRVWTKIIKIETIARKNVGQGAGWKGPYTKVRVV